MTTMNLSQELRQLAVDLEAVAKDSPCYSNVHSIIQSTNSHITAMARAIELRDRNTLIEMKMLAAMQTTSGERDETGKVRWLYMVNWVVSVLKQNNPDFDAAAFYRALGV